MEAALIARIGADLTDLRAKMGEASGIVGGFQSTLAKIGPMVAGAFSVGAIVAFGKAALTAAGEAVDGETRLMNALKGRADIQQRLLKQAESIHNTTLFEDDAIIQQQALLATFGRTEDQINKIIKASVQLSAATGVELPEAVFALNKSLEGVDRGLKAIDPTIHGLTAAQLEHGAAIDLVTQKYDGFAEKATGTYAGSLHQLSKAWGELMEAIGRKALPDPLVIQALSNSINGGFVTGGSKDKPWWEDMLNALGIYKKETGATSTWPAPPKQEIPIIQKAINRGPRKPGEAGGDPTAGIAPDLDYLKEYTKSWFTTEYPDLVKGSLEEVNDFRKESELANSEYMKELYQQDLDNFDRSQKEKTAMALRAGTAIGANLGMAAAGAKTLEQAIKQSTFGIVGDMLNQALAGMYARISETVPFPLSVGLIAAGQAFISSLFAGLASGGGGGGGGGGAGGGGTYTRSNESLLNGAQQSLFIRGESRIEGNAIRVLWSRTDEANSFTKPSLVGG